ncbi:O-antigen ligase [Aquimarina sp. I32.4]|uniref:O-antigen ligase family protein n=1 Tax=Aquimarina sp. I32.4 TaxID=2053903 RepID=UPI000CDE8A5D|nr:O-antigen ligase family protein [Aquimarina sp. I32.4]
MNLKELFRFLFYIFSFSIPFIGFNIPKYILGALITLKIIDFVLDFKNYKLLIIEQKYFLLSAILLPLYIAITLLYSADIYRGFSALGRYSFCFVMPFLFLSTDHQKFFTKKISIFFMYGVTSFIILNFILLLYNWNTPESFAYSYSKYYYDNLAGLVRIHPGYYSLKIAISIFISIFYIRNRMKWLLILLFSIVLVALSSKGIIITTAFGIFLLLIRFLVIKKQFKYIPIFSLLIFTSIFILFKTFAFNRFSTMIDSFSKNIDNIPSVFEDRQNRLDENLIRLFIFKYSYETIIENNRTIFFGYGIGDYKNALMQKYQEEEFVFGLHYKYNSHNQYLSIMLMSGLIGLLLYAFYFLSPILLFNKVHLIYYYILLLFLTYGLIESFFARESGILIASFFVSLFLAQERIRSIKYF